MKILITGSQGFIGQKLAASLYNKGYELVLYDFLPINNYSESKNLNLIGNSDISESQNFHLIPWNELDYIFHLASAGVKSSGRKSEICNKVNIVGTKNLLDAIGNFENPPKIIYPRTFYENYVNSIDLISKDAYFSTKAEAYENILEWKNSRKNAVIIAVTLFQVYGAHDDSNNLINYLISKMLKNKVARVGNFDIKRDWIYYEDTITALSLIPILDLNHSTNFDIGSGVLYSIQDIVINLSKILNKDKNLVVEDTKRYRNDVEIKPCARNFIPKWKPSYTLFEGLKKMTLTHSDNL